MSAGSLVFYLSRIARLNFTERRVKDTYALKKIVVRTSPSSLMSNIAFLLFSINNVKAQQERLYSDKSSYFINVSQKH